ncbi:hypothetical protein [Maribellus sp. YY47]|uniref:hypothetical protein n=1 Tax=Maribellus sp. YY47 TaxID=2929486 RepID=UPI002001511C|nr:hypothetical protein [Maribellus sp. YY47]MCK3683631.1 hypothetical protein [Maribellus sp. YY47]
MKTKSWVLFTLTLFIAAIGSATDFPKMNVVQVEKDKAMLAYSASTATPLEITLTNSDGEILYFNCTNERYREYKKLFDFSKIGDGDYCLSVNFGNQSVSRSLSINHNKMEVGPPQKCYVPCFNLNGNQLDISFLNTGMKQVYVNIYHNGEHIEEAKLGRDLAIQKRLDLKRLRPGEYLVVVSERFKDHTFIAKL